MRSIAARESMGPRRPSICGSTHVLILRPLSSYQDFQSVANSTGLAAPHVIDLSGLSAEREGDDGPGHVADIDEIATSIEVPDGKLQGVRSRLGQPCREPAERLTWR